MIDLAPYVGKHVVLVFGRGDAWLASHVEKGKPSILMSVDPQTKQMQGVVPLPFLQGELITAGAGYAVMIEDHQKNRLQVGVAADRVVTCTIAVEAPRVQLIG